jgi:soluble epoxide hydrolase / lipid-phosphate phosphatase
MVVWRAVLFHPELVSHVFSVCSPYDTPKTRYMSTEALVKGPAPQFGYQLHLESGEVEKRITSKQDIRQFLSGMYGGRGPNRELLFSPEKGILFENLAKIGPSPLITDKVCLRQDDTSKANGKPGAGILC